MSALSEAFPWRSFRRNMLLVIGAGLVARLIVFFMAAGDPERFYTLDARGYMAAAHDLRAAYFTPDSATWAIGLARTPGYPVFAAGGLSIHPSEAAVVLAQIVVALATIWCLLRVGVRHVDPRTGIIAAMLFALDPASVLYANVLQPEICFTALLVVGVSFWFQAGSSMTGSLLRGAIAGACMGAATLFRPIGLFLPFAFTVISVFGRRGLHARRLVGFLIAFLALPGAWIARNVYATGVPILSTIEGENLLNYRAAGALAFEEQRDIEDARKELRTEIERTMPAGAGPAELSHRQSRLAVRVLVEHPSGAFRSAADGAVRLLTGTGATMLQHLRHGSMEEAPVDGSSAILQGLALTYLLSLYAASLRGAVLMRREGQGDVAATCLILIAYFVLISAGPEANTRFRVPLMPFLALLAARGLQRRPSGEAGSRTA